MLNKKADSFNSTNTGVIKPAPSESSTPVVAAISRPSTRHQVACGMAAPKLTSEETRMYANLFLDLDTDRNGWLSREEIGVWLRGAGYKLRDQQIENIFRIIDSNADGRITLDEFYIFMELMQNPPNNTSNLRRVFESMDTNGDGQLSVMELQLGLNKCGYNLTMEQVQKFVTNLDTNGDGQISFEEFIAAFK